MTTRELEGIRVAAILTDGFEQVEYTIPKEALLEEGAIVHIVSPSIRRVRAMNHTRWGDTFEVDVPIEEAVSDDYDAVLLPGGVWNADKLRTNQDVKNFLKEIDDENKPIATICHAPWILVSADIVRGRKLTSYYTIQDDICNAGGDWIDETVVVDGNLITSRKPDDIPAFNNAIIKKLQALDTLDKATALS